MLQFIVGDGDTKFMASFWKHLFRKVGMKLLFDMAFHPQTDGQIERVNEVLNQYFKNYVGVNKKDWGEHLGLAKFYCNSTTHLAMKMSPFELMLGKEAKKPMDLAISMGCKDHSKEVVEMVKGREEKYARAKKLLEHAQKGYEKHANKTQRHVEFEVGQHMWLNIQNFKMPNRLAPHFITKYAGLYEILHKPHPNMYTLKLPTNFVAHPTFHISKLKLFLQDNQRPNRKQKVRPEMDVIKHRLAAKIEGILCVT